MLMMIPRPSPLTTPPRHINAKRLKVKKIVKHENFNIEKKKHNISNWDENETSNIKNIYEGEKITNNSFRRIPELNPNNTFPSLYFYLEHVVLLFNVQDQKLNSVSNIFVESTKHLAPNINFRRSDTKYVLKKTQTKARGQEEDNDTTAPPCGKVWWRRALWAALFLIVNRRGKYPSIFTLFSEVLMQRVSVTDYTLHCNLCASVK